MACHISVAPPAGWASFGVLPIFAARNSLFLCRMDNFPGDIAVFLLFVYTRRNNRRLCCLCSTPPSCVEALSGAPRRCRWLLDVADPPKHCPLQPLVVAVPPKHWPLRSLALHCGFGCPYRRRRLSQPLLVYTLLRRFWDHNGKNLRTPICGFFYLRVETARSLLPEAVRMIHSSVCYPLCALAFPRCLVYIQRQEGSGAGAYRVRGVV